MGIQINGQTDVISAADGSLTVSGADLTSAINFSVSGVGTITDLRATNANITGVGTIATLIVTGNASIGGTVTYMDVTNVDSVGIITAQVGLQVLANGINVTGVSTLSGGVNASQGVDATGLRVTGITTLGQTNITGLSNAGVSTLGNATASTLVVSGVSTLGAASATLLNVSGVVTATSFSGSGANLTGVAATSNISTNAIVNSGVTTVAAGSAAAPSISPTGDTDTGIFFPSADTIAFGEGGAEAARFDSSGRFGVGTASPGALVDLRAASDPSLHISTTGYTPDYRGYSIDLSRAQQTGGINFTTSSPSAFLDLYAGGSATNAGAWNGQIRFFTGGTDSYGTEAMRINNAQELLIGYTSDNGAYKLQVNSQIFATSATIATSDGRYKENVATLDGCVDLVKAFRPVSFDWKPQQDITRTDEDGNEVLVREGHNFPDGTQVGFIAQEVQEVLTDKPWLTSVIKQNVRPAVTDAEGNELAPEEEFLGIAEGNLIAVLTSALQEAIGEIESLKARLTAAGIE